MQQESTFWSAKLNRSIDLEKLRGFRLAGDYFLWHSFASQAPLHSVYSHLGAFRIHHGQLSTSIDAYNEEALSLVRPMTFREKLTEYWSTAAIRPSAAFCGITSCRHHRPASLSMIVPRLGGRRDSLLLFVS